MYASTCKDFKLIHGSAILRSVTSRGGSLGTIHASTYITQLNRFILKEVVVPENILSHMVLIIGSLRGSGTSPRSAWIHFSGQGKFAQTVRGEKTKWE